MCLPLCHMQVCVCSSQRAANSSRYFNIEGNSWEMAPSTSLAIETLAFLLPLERSGRAVLRLYSRSNVDRTRDIARKTAPVLVTSETAADTMAFVLPASRFASIAEAPAPTDSRLRLRELPERLQAVRVFSWNFGAAAAKRHLEALLKDLAADGWTPKRRADGCPPRRS